MKSSLSLSLLLIVTTVIFRTTDECGTGPFLRWDRAQDRRPDIPSISENASSPIGIHLKKGRLRRQGVKPSSTEDRAWEDAPTEARGVCQCRLRYTNTRLFSIRVRQSRPTTAIRDTTQLTRSASPEHGPPKCIASAADRCDWFVFLRFLFIKVLKEWKPQFIRA